MARYLSLPTYQFELMLLLVEDFDFVLRHLFFLWKIKNLAHIAFLLIIISNVRAKSGSKFLTLHLFKRRVVISDLARHRVYKQHVVHIAEHPLHVAVLGPYGIA